MLIICIQDTAFKFWLNLSSYLCGGRGRGVGPRGGGLGSTSAPTHMFTTRNETHVYTEIRDTSTCVQVHTYEWF